MMASKVQILLDIASVEPYEHGAIQHVVRCKFQNKR